MSRVLETIVDDNIIHSKWFLELGGYTERNIMSEAATAVIDAPAKERKQLTDVQKQAATLRRDAALLRKYGNESKAAELDAQANEMAPSSGKPGRVDPLKQLSAEDQNKLKNYLRTTAGFARLCSVVSYKKLAEIVSEIG